MQNLPNPALAKAMQELRRSSATQRHANKAKQAKKGLAKGGRAGARAALRKEV